MLSLPIISEYVETGLVPRLPTALLSTGMVLSSIIFFIAGLILETITMGRREIKRLAYLAIPSLTCRHLHLTQNEDMAKFKK